MKANFYKCVVIFCALLTTLTITVHATPTIALTETDSYETFVAAINSAENGDTVRLTNNINVSQPIFVIDKNITICLDGSVKAKSADDVAAVFNIKGGEVTIKSSSGATVKGTKTLFDVNDGANVSLDGIKMEKTSSNGSNYGVRAASGSTVEITNCSVEYHGYVNAPDTSFYGIYADSATISVKNTSFVLTQSIDGYVSEMYGIFGNVSSILRLSGINIIVAQSECAKKSKAYGVCSEGSGEISESQVLTYSAYTAKAISGGSEFSVISGKYAADGKNKSAVSGVSVKSGSFNTDPSAFVVGGGVVRTDGTESYDYEYESANLAALDRVLRYVVEGAAEPCAHEKMTEVVVVEASCEQNGLLRRVCDNCNFYEEKEISALGHNCIVTDTKEPTCTADGYTAYKCSRCEYGYTEKQNMLEHNCIVTDTKEPTCTEDGYTAYKCSRCEYGYTERQNMLGHEIVHHEGKVPTCLEVGYEAYDTCSRCDYSTFTELGRLSHEYSSDWTVDLDATCSREGKKSRHCLYCSATTEETAIPKTAHREKRTLLKEATCDNDGVAQYECLDCGEKREEALPMSGHSYIETSRSNPSCETSGIIVYVCEKCGKNSVTVIPDLGHEFGTFIEELAPTCSLYGQKAHYKCQRCGEYFDEYKNDITEEDIILDKKPHEYSSPKVIKKSTCQEKGELLYTCLRCGSQYTETTEKSPHVLRFVTGKAATCIEDGFADYEECSVCDYSTMSVIEKYGHDYCPDWIVSDYPTCESAGSKTHVCRRCGQNDGMVIMEKLGHDFVKFEDVQPTCENSGERGHRECRRCGKVEKEILPAIGHRYEQVSKTQPTCISDGFIVYECANCGRTKEEALFMLGHELEFFDVLMPSCTQKGHNAYEKCVRCDYTTYKEYAQLGHDMIFVEGKTATCEIGGYCDYEKCLRCGFSTIKEIPALGHKYDNEYTVDKQPSCDEKGERSRHCLTCGNRIDVTSIPMKPHDFVKTVLSERSCETDYEAIFECKVCGIKEKTFEPMYGHDCIFVGEKQPTCTEDGYEEYSCSRCEYGYRDVLSKLGHDIIHHGGKLPSCEAKGWNEYETCSRCDYSTYSEIEAKGHRRLSAVVENRREPTCTSDGSFDHVEYCGECQKELSREKEILSKLGHNVGKIGEKQPTCTEDGYEEYSCSRCEYGYIETVFSDGHRFGDWKIEEGNHAKLCVKCGFKQSYTHEYGESETTKEPTLSDDGEQLRECKVCGYRFIQKLSKINVTATCDGECIDGAITATYDKETDEVTVTATEIDNKKFKGWYDGDICVCQEKTYTFARNSVGVKALYEDDKGETTLLLVAVFFVALASVATVVGFRYKKRKK